MSIFNNLVGTFNSAVESVTETYNTLGASSHTTIQVNGKAFWITKLLSEGGFSLVYLAHDESKQLFAIKTMRGSSSKIAIKEALLTDRFQHHGIIQIVDMCMVKEHDGNKTVYIIMPYYKRGNLQDLMEKNFLASAHIPERQLLLLFQEVCLSVQVLVKYTDKRGKSIPYAHRDIKPANILLSDEGSSVLMDFGSAKPARIPIDDKRAASVAQDDAAEHCSMPYRAPELFAVKPGTVLNEKVDIWSLGCTLFAVAYGASPFEMTVSQQGGTLALAVLNRQFRFPHSLYSQSFQDLIGWMLTTDPDQRPSIDDVLLRLDTVIQPEKP